MEEENKYIETLLERFFEGQTSNEEERRLYHFFDREEIPDELAQFKPIVKYFESGLMEEMGLRKDTKVRRLKKIQVIWGSIAASFLIIMFGSLLFLKNAESFDSYEGSYIVRNGVRITDLNLIRPELEAAIQKSVLLEQQADQLIERLTAMDDSREVEILQKFQDHNQQILDNIQDEKIRIEIGKNLNLNL